jgi:glucose-1-phosphate thymidylyltransferase
VKSIILAAGYATRLYPLTKDKPKPLLEVGGKAILAHILEKVARVAGIDKVLIITNDKFYTHFVEWVQGYAYALPIQVINDGTTSNENRLGAIADLQLVLEQEAIVEDVLVLAGDNLFDFELSEFVSFYHQVGRDCITTHVIDDMERIKQTGVIELEGNRVMSFEEKPEAPRSHFAVPPFYMYKQETLPLVKQYLEADQNPDAPGNFLPWLLQHREVYAFRFEGHRYDVGTLESYEEVQRVFGIC